MPPKKAPRLWAKQSAMRILEKMEQAAQQNASRVPGLRLANRAHASQFYSPTTARGRIETNTYGPATESRREDGPYAVGGASHSPTQPSSKEPLDEASTSRTRMPQLHKPTIADIVADASKRKLSDGAADAMALDSPFKSFKSQGRGSKHNSPPGHFRSDKAMNTSRHRGREKGTVVWRVQPERGDLVVRERVRDSDDPSISLEQAVKIAKAGARIFVEGNHSWTGTLVLDKRIQIVGAGAWVTCLNGRWLLQDKEATGPEHNIGCQEAFDSVRPVIGGFSGVHLSHTLGQGRKMRISGSYMTETLVIRQGAWRFHSCKITSDSSPPMLLSGRADVKALECRIGGRGGGELRSSSGVIVTGESTCALDTCVLENTDDESYTEVADCARLRRSMPTERLSPFAQQFGPGFAAAASPVSPFATADHSFLSVASPDASLSRTMSAYDPNPRKQQQLEDNFHSTAILVRHTATVEVECCKFVRNFVAITIADCGHAVVNNSLFHNHNQGAIFGILSAGDHVRESVLEVKDNKIARSQDKSRTAIGRPGRYIRRDGLGTWEELEPEVRRALARLESLFEGETVLFTTMSLSIK